MEEPFRIFQDGIFFKTGKGEGLSLTPETMKLIKLIKPIEEAMNGAYQKGWTEGVSVGITIKETQLKMKEQNEKQGS